MRKFCLFTYRQDQNELHLKDDFFLSKSASSVDRYVFGGRIKLIICQISYRSRRGLLGSVLAY